MIPSAAAPPLDRDELLPAELLESLGSLEIAARVLARAFRAGRHRSPFTGSGEEFERHRPYQQGDELRHLDWRLFARSDRLHVRRYRETAAHPTWILMDATASMGFQGGERVPKLRWGTLFAAATAHLLLGAGDPVGLASVGEGLRIHLPVRARPGHRGALFDALDRLEPEGSGDLGAAVEGVGERMPRSGRLIVVSDLLGRAGEEAGLAAALGTVAGRGGEAVAIRVADPAELGVEPPDRGVYADPEDPKAPRASTADAEGFRNRVEAYYSGLRGTLEARGVEVVLLTTDLPLLPALTGWLGPR